MFENIDNKEINCRYKENLYLFAQNLNILEYIIIGNYSILFVIEQYNFYIEQIFIISSKAYLAIIVLSSI